MSDDRNTRGRRPDRDRININEEHELRNWAQSLGVTPERVIEAVQAVGDRSDRVREHLGAPLEHARRTLEEAGYQVIPPKDILGR